jgi:hypothetical protein
MTKLRLKSRAGRLRYPGVAIHTFEVRNMPMHKLHCSVLDVPAFAEDVAESIKEHGLANPIIVVRAPREDMVLELTSLNGVEPRLPEGEVLNVVYGGTNRFTAARLLGHTYVDCVLLPTFRLALQVQDQQRETYNGTEAFQAGS